MNQQEIESMLIEIVCDLQKISGREVVGVTANTKPIKDVPGFDSLNGVESTVEVISRVNRDLPFNNVFVNERKALTVREAAARLMDCIEGRTH